MAVSATEAKNKFGAICAQAKIAPVFVEKDGRLDSVILSIQQYNALNNDKDKKALKGKRQQFELRYASWFKEQNDRFEAYGLWCDDLRTW
jgi:hypothetical protein